MPLYSIRRRLGENTQEDLDAAVFRAIVCAFQFDGLEWQRSFWNKEAGEVNCIYEAQEPGQIEEHARVSRISCDSIVEVREVRPEPYIHG